MNFMRGFFDADTYKVLAAGLIGGTFSGMSPDKIVAIAVGIVTFLYIAVKLIKQLRDWNKPDQS